jgi:glycosyltransferase involved in cell wall biosynthesis
MINICYVLGTFRVGGAENLILQIINNLDKKKYRIFVAAFSKTGPLYQKYQDAGVTVYTFPQKKAAFFSFLKFLKFLRQAKIDSLHINLSGTYLFSLTAARLLRIRNIICHWHNVYYYTSETRKSLYQDFLVWFLLKYSGKTAHSIIAISQKVKDYNCNTFNIKRDKVRVIYNGIDFSLIPPNTRNHQNPSHKVIIGSIGKVTEQKGFDTLITAFKIIAEKYPHCTLEIVGAVSSKGNEKYSQSILELVNKLGLADSVLFTGAIPYDEVYKRLFTWAVFVLPSKWEGFGLVIIEAMASGVPVIASKVDAIPEIIDDGKSGLLFKVNDPQDLSEKIIRLLEQKELSMHYVQNAALRVREKFSIQNMIVELDDLYSKASA